MARPVLLVLALLPVAASMAQAQGTSSRESSTAAAAAQASIPNATETLLDRLVGDWQMVGHVGSKPVTYTLAVCRVLGGRYIELHMTDVQRPPQYEARVFVGADTVPGRVIVHWLDSFGAASSVPHAAGTVRGDTLQFEFAYSSGPFRDTFVHDRETGRWTFRLEAGDGRGAWRLFADYEVSPRPRVSGKSAEAHCRQDARTDEAKLQ